MSTSPVEIYLNSRYPSFIIGSESDNSDILFYFSTPVVRPPGHLMCLRLSNLTIPVSWTLINEDNEKLVIDGVSYSITHGNYSANQLVLKINDILHEAGVMITMTYDSIRGKFVFTHSLEDFTISSESSCLEVLGFTESDHPSVEKVVESDAIINLSGAVNVLYVDLPNIATGNISSQRGTKTTIIKSIPISSSQGEIMIWENTSNSYVVLWNDYIQFFHVRLLDETMSKAIKMNHQHWNMTLEVFFEKYETNNQKFNDIINNYETRTQTEPAQ